jgi:hypothetical protein
MRKLFLCSIVLLTYLNLVDVKQLMAQEPLDGRNRIFRDELLDNLVGDWKLTQGFHNTFTWNPELKRWVFLMEQKDQTGKWKVFAEDSLRRP